LFIVGIEDFGNVFGVALLVDCAEIVARVERAKVKGLGGFG